jgi:aminoglycoside 3-N-acetyltransferase
MSEKDAIAATPTPRTRITLGEDFRTLGVQEGGVLLVHSSLSALGWVCGGAITVIDALLDVLGPQGTLVMPAHSSDLSDPEKWCAPAVPVAWLNTIRETMPAFDPFRTPTRGMGAIPELFRMWPHAKRSSHPTSSFAALGPEARQITEAHALEQPLGEASPLARLYDLDASILLLGVSFDRCTAFHLAEHRAFPEATLEIEGSPVMEDGARHWKSYYVPPYDTEFFENIGEQLSTQGLVTIGQAGSAACCYMGVRQVVDFATAYLRRTKDAVARGTA